MSDSEEILEADSLHQNRDEEIDNKPQEKGSRLLQYLVGFLVCLSIVGMGTHRAWTSPALPYLKNPNPYFTITDSQATWIASFLIIGDSVGSLIDPLCIDRFGRKASVILFTIPAIISWLMIIYAENYVHLYMARFLAGVHQGGCINILIIYISEIAEKRIRGVLGNFMRTAGTLGYFICTTVSAFLPFRLWNSVCMLIPFVFFLVAFLMPESPYYYFMHNREKEAVETLMTLRRVTDPKTLEAEIKEIKFIVAETKNNNKMVLMKLLRNKQNLRDMTITGLMMVTQLFSGILAVNFYTEEILSFSDYSLKPAYQVMIVTGITVIACAFATLVIDRFERKSLYLWSGIMCSISLQIISVFYFMKLYLKMDVSSVKWIPLLGLVLYKVSYSQGMGPIPDIVMGEIFPVDVKATAISFVVVVSSLFCYVVTVGYEIVTKTAGIYTAFFVFSIFAFFGSIFIYVITPSTMGKTLEEIQTMKNIDLNERLQLRLRESRRNSDFQK